MMTSTRAKAFYLLLFVCTALGAAVFLLSRVGTSVLPTGDRYTVEAQVRDAVALAAAADVRQAGVKIGRVQEIKERGALTALKLVLDPKYAPVFRNATVLIRAKSIAEENYVELDPGSPRAGAVPDGGVLPPASELEATQNDDVFSILDRRRRESLRRALAGLGAGLDGPGAAGLNRTLEGSAAVVDQGAGFARVLAEERSHVARLVDSFGTVARALGNRADAIRALTRSSKAAAQAVATRDTQLQSTIDALPGFLAQAHQTATRLDGFSGRATPVMRDLRLATQALVPTVRDLRPAAAEGRRTLRALQSFARTGTPAFAQLDRFATATPAFVGPYETFLRQLNPFVDYLEPYYRELRTWFALAGAATDVTDSVGHVARVLLPISRSSFPGTLPPATEALLSRLTAPADTRGSNAFPAPGTAGAPQAFTGHYPRLSAEPPYPRPGHQGR